MRDRGLRVHVIDCDKYRRNGGRFHGYPGTGIFSYGSKGRKHY